MGNELGNELVNELIKTDDAIENKKNTIRIIAAVVFWGSIWGLVEATIGYILHLVRLQGFRGITSFFLFPMACYYMDQVRKQTSDLWAIVYMALLAAGIKLLDFFIPGHDPIRIIYPSIAIILEGMAVFGAFAFAKKKERKFGYPEALFVSVSWRIVFTLIQFATLPSPSMYPSSQSLVRFILMDSVVNSLVISLYIKLIKLRKNKEGKISWQISPIVSVMIFVLAILSKWVI